MSQTQIHSLCHKLYNDLQSHYVTSLSIDQSHVDQISNVQPALETRSANNEQIEQINTEESTSENIRQRDHRKDTNTAFDHKLGKDGIVKVPIILFINVRFKPQIDYDCMLVS